MSGWKTPKFWLTLLATAAATALGTGAIPAGPIVEIVGAGVAALGAAGYASVRARDKAVAMDQVPPANGFGTSPSSPAWKTTEFWLTAGTSAALLTGLALGEGSREAQLVATGVTIVGHLARHALPPVK